VPAGAVVFTVPNPPAPKEKRTKKKAVFRSGRGRGCKAGRKKMWLNGNGRLPYFFVTTL
jgi:hypothetical protein